MEAIVLVKVAWEMLLDYDIDAKEGTSVPHEEGHVGGVRLVLPWLPADNFIPC